MEPESDAAALSSITTALEELTQRVVDLATRYDGTPRADVASDLYDAERGLRSAARRLRRVHEGLRRDA